jgi:hypothetical protein
MGLLTWKKACRISLLALSSLLIPTCDRVTDRAELRLAAVQFSLIRAADLPALHDPCSLVSIEQVRLTLNVLDASELQRSSADYRCELRVNREAEGSAVLSLAFQQLDGFPHSVGQPEALAGPIGRAMGWPQVSRYAGRLDGNYLFVSDADEHVTRVLLVTRYQISMMQPTGRLVITAELVSQAPSTDHGVDQLSDVVDQFSRRFNAHLPSGRLSK